MTDLISWTSKFLSILTFSLNNLFPRDVKGETNQRGREWTISEAVIRPAVLRSSLALLCLLVWKTHTCGTELLKTISVMQVSHEHCSQYPYFHGSPFSMEYHKEWMNLEHCLYTSSIKGIFNKLLHIRIRISSLTFRWKHLKPNSDESAHRSRKWSSVVYS